MIGPLNKEFFMGAKIGKKLILKLVIILFFNQPYNAALATNSFNLSNSSIGIIGTVMGVEAGVIGTMAVLDYFLSSLHENFTVEDPAKINANSLFLSEPNVAYNLIITNSSEVKKVTVNSVTLNSEVYGVTVGAISPTCSSMLPHSSCNISLTATQEAYGTGIATISYNKGKELTVAVQVAPTTLELYETTSGSEKSISSNQDIILKPKGTSTTDITQNFKYKNSGKFSWQNPASGSKVAWETMFDGEHGEVGGSEYYVSLDKDSCGNSGSIAPQGSCSFKLITHHDHPGDWGVLQINGLNLGGKQVKNALAGGGLSIAMDLDPADYHLGYRAIKITNTMPTGQGYGDMRFNSITASGSLIAGTDPVVKYCAPDATDCDGYNTTCKISSNPSDYLLPGTNCLVWFKAKDKKGDGTTDLDLQTISDTLGRIMVAVEGQKKMQSGILVDTWVDFSDYENDCTFTASYNNSLYAGGFFTQAGGNGANYIARWDGTSWATLGVGTDSYVLTSAVMKGDLYVGGQFTHAGGVAANNIAKWDGTSWNSLGDGLSSSVNTIVDIGTNLYAGGYFLNAGTVSAKYIAKWDGTSWSSVGTGELSGGGAEPTQVNAITNINNDIYVGGIFTQAGAVSVNHIVKWDGANWDDVGSGVHYGFGTPRVYTMININNNIYVGGGFDSAGTIAANSVAKWSGTAWENLGTGIYLNSGFFAYVFALSIIDNDLYVGGYFDRAGGNSISNIAKWDGSNWSPLGYGVNYTVLSLGKLGTNLYVGGVFTQAGGNLMSYIARWNAVTETWSPLGTGVSSQVRSITITPALLITGYDWSSS
jgi:hypothetical protein